MAKDIDVTLQTDDGLKALIKNHQIKGAQGSPLYLAALRELEKRTGRGLDFDKSFEIIRQAAIAGKFISYKDLADASEASWSRVHYEVGGHLWRLVEYSTRMGWPMLSAIVVNKPNVKTGKMEAETLKGFAAAARALGLPVLPSDEEFLEAQQKAVFAWGSAIESESATSSGTVQEMD